MFEVEFWSQSLRQLSSDCPSAPNWPFFPGFVNQELDTANSSPLRVGTVTGLFTEDNGGAVPPEGGRKLHPLSVPICHLFMRHGSPATLTHQLQPHSGATPPALCSCFHSSSDHGLPHVSPSHGHTDRSVWLLYGTSLHRLWLGFQWWTQGLHRSLNLSLGLKMLEAPESLIPHSPLFSA